MIVQNQKYGRFGILHQGFEEADESIRIHCPLNGFETKFSTGEMAAIMLRLKRLPVLRITGVSPMGAKVVLLW
ncbi:hypothetical protein [Stutzerimonas stutzeri]|uniref:hypothetical protein n=1 Tax=Stutzerimonas stutzeri TaxID=316 RepID=UPI00210C6FE7|nr:hypothetical protein [Stutzerimonas stutzeri]MCQ4319231.1 hypothetical protein [Stutzerimonas stutzeri]